ncbi:MAG: divalent-cation tolerance protein CutA [Synechococcaceae cyanobacterium ELA739]
MVPPEDPPCRLSLVLTSEGSAERAESLARELVQRRLVACASLWPVRSHYRWQGTLESSDEVKLLLKTSPDHLAELHAVLMELHSYETPEWIHWEAGSGGGYGQWLAEQLSPGDGPPAPPGSPGDGAPAG